MPRRLAPAVLLTAALLAAGAAHAQATHVWRCPSADGKRITYSDQPCENGTGKGGEITLHPNEIDTRDARERAMQTEIDRLRREMDAMKEKSAAPPVARPTIQRLPSETPACIEARKAYEEAAEDNFTNKRTVEARRHSMNAACGINDITTNTTIQTDNSIHFRAPRIQAPSRPPVPPKPAACQGGFVKDMWGKFVYKPGYCPDHSARR